MSSLNEVKDLSSFRLDIAGRGHISERKHTHFSEVTYGE